MSTNYQRQISQTPKARPSSSYNRQTPINSQKREKLKELLIAKFVKRFNTPHYENLIRSEVTTFIFQEKLTEKDLIQFEQKLKKLIEDSDNKAKLKTTLEAKTVNAVVEESKKETIKGPIIVKKEIPKTPSVNIKKAQSLLDKMGLDYEEINDFKLRKLFNEQRPVNKINMNNDEWTEIAHYKNKVNAEFLRQQQLEEHEKKLRTRATYLQQMEEKKNKKEIEKMRDRTYHEATMDNIARLYNRELEEAKTLKDKKEVEREIRDRQIQENVERKVNEFTVNRVYDKQISKYLLI
jgi:hypothetical protein